MVALCFPVLGVDDLDRELGGWRVDWQRWPDDPDFIVVEDTEGNRFCLVDLDHE